MCAPRKLLAYTVVSTDDCVDIRVLVPAAAAPGTQVLFHRVSVSGRALSLANVCSHIIVGFNHAPAAAGPVMAATKSGDVCALRRALALGGSTEEEENLGGVCTPVRTALAYYCHAEHDLYLEVFRVLVEAGANLNAYAYHSQSLLLHGAIAARMPKVVRILVDAGADIEMKDPVRMLCRDDGDAVFMFLFFYSLIANLIFRT
jgi:hypothetical protein